MELNTNLQHLVLIELHKNSLLHGCCHIAKNGFMGAVILPRMGNFSRSFEDYVVPKFLSIHNHRALRQINECLGNSVLIA